jgi:hypothetical protein
MVNRTTALHADLVGYQWPMLTEMWRLSIPDGAISAGSPDGKVLFLPAPAEDEFVLRRVDTVGRTVTRIAKLPGHVISVPTFLPEGMVFIARKTHSDAWRRTAAGTFEQLTHNDDIGSVAPCGRGYVATTYSKEMLILDADGRVKRRFASSSLNTMSAVCSPDGRDRYVVGALPKSGLYRWGDDEAPELFANVVTPFIAMAPDGKRLALAKPSPAAFVASWMSLTDRQLHEIGISDSNCEISWASNHSVWLAKRRGGRLLWIEVDVDTRAETGQAVEGAHICANGLPDPQSPGNKDLRVETTTTSEIRSVPLSALGYDAAR